MVPRRRRLLHKGATPRRWRVGQAALATMGELEIDRDTQREAVRWQACDTQQLEGSIEPDRNPSHSRLMATVPSWLHRPKGQCPSPTFFLADNGKISFSITSWNGSARAVSFVSEGWCCGCERKPCGGVQ